jgi:hypothetical protein
MKDRFYEELECVFDKFPRYHMNIFLGDFNAKVGMEDIFKQTIGNESLYEISNANGVRVVNFVTFKGLSRVSCDSEQYRRSLGAALYPVHKNQYQLVTVR